MKPQIQTIIQELESIKPSSYNDGYAGGYIDACDFAIKKLSALLEREYNNGAVLEKINNENVMRSLQFRIWDGKNMFYPGDNSRIILEYCKISGWNLVPNFKPNDGKYIAGQSSSNNNFEMMQFTGIKDKNGKEVYDGDIVKYIRENWHCPSHPLHQKDLVDTCEIYWCDKEHSFRQRGNFEKGGGWSGGIQFDDHRAKNCTIEVIGNIYENPDLLQHKSTS